MGDAGVATEESCVLHAVAGRVRVHMPGWSGQGKRQIEMQLHQVQAARRIQANPVTGNILILFDPATISEQAILHSVQTLDLKRINAQADEPELPPVVSEKQGKTVQSRIA